MPSTATEGPSVRWRGELIQGWGHGHERKREGQGEIKKCIDADGRIQVSAPAPRSSVDPSPVLSSPLSSSSRCSPCPLPPPHLLPPLSHSPLLPSPLFPVSHHPDQVTSHADLACDLASAWQCPEPAVAYQASPPSPPRPLQRASRHLAARYWPQQCFPPPLVLLLLLLLLPLHPPAR